MGNRWGGAASYAVAVDEPFFPGPLQDANPRFVVGVIDSGIVLKDGRPHPPLDGHLTNDWLANEDPLPTDGSILGELVGHGTFVAGRILMAAPTVTISMRAVLGRSTSTDDATLAAIDDFTAMDDVKVVNMSFSGDQDPQRTEPADIKQAIDALIHRRPDIVIVAAAGNSWSGNPAWPAAFTQDFPQVISVGALDETVIIRRHGRPPRASFSNYGSWVDIYESGVQVLGPRCTYRELVTDSVRQPQNYTGLCRWSGTSFAAATISGRIAQAMIDHHLTGQQATALVLGMSPELSTSET
jgi:subtilisin family serine protease